MWLPLPCLDTTILPLSYFCWYCSPRTQNNHPKDVFSSSIRCQRRRNSAAMPLKAVSVLSGSSYRPWATALVTNRGNSSPMWLSDVTIAFWTVLHCLYVDVGLLMNSDNTARNVWQLSRLWARVRAGAMGGRGVEGGRGLDQSLLFSSRWILQW